METAQTTQPGRPYVEIVADTPAQAAAQAKQYYGQTNPKVIVVTGSRDGRKTFKVVDDDAA